MTDRITLDLITYDEGADEYVLYLVEDGPWPTSDADWRTTLLRIQTRVLSTADAAIDGILALKYPDSIGKRIRIQVDSPSSEPEPLHKLIDRLREFLSQDSTYKSALENSKFIRGLRVVTGHEMGRFHK